MQDAPLSSVTREVFVRRNRDRRKDMEAHRQKYELPVPAAAPVLMQKTFTRELGTIEEINERNAFVPDSQYSYTTCSNAVCHQSAGLRHLISKRVTHRNRQVVEGEELRPDS